jgi:hypothetical protein
LKVHLVLVSPFYAGHGRRDRCSGVMLFQTTRVFTVMQIR